PRRWPSGTGPARRRPCTGECACPAANSVFAWPTWANGPTSSCPAPPRWCSRARSPSRRSGERIAEVILGLAGAVAPHPQHPVSSSGGRAENAVSVVEGRREPTLQRVGAEVSLHDQPRIAALIQARYPPFEQAVQFVL